MIGIKVNGRFLDLKPGATGEIERKSPFFAMEDSTSEVSTPLSVLYTQNNALALGLPFQYYTERIKKKYDAEQYDDNSYRGKCTLVIETGKLNLNNIEATEMTGYVLYGISNFYQEVKGKKLSDLTLGGARSFNWTTNNPYDGSAGFWQHIHKSWTDSTIPYVFQPIRNEAYFGKTGPVDWMNKLNNQATILYDEADGFRNNPLVPMIRVKYLLEQIFAEANITVDFTGLNDTEWEKLILVNLTKVDWIQPGPVTANGQTTIIPRPANVIKIQLRRHVPQDKLISDFILQLFNRYGWAPLFDGVSRKCRLVAVKELENGRVKDWTQYVEPAIDSNFNEDKKIFAFTNDIDSNDSLPSAPDLNNQKIGLPAAYARYLPNPTAGDVDLIRFCYHDNQWYQVKLDDTTNRYEWKLFGDNIYNEEPFGATDTIATTISTLPSYYTDYREENGIAFSGYFPAMEQEATKNIGYRTLLYHGLRQELAYNGTNAGALLYYPHASATREDPLGITPLTWSNVYTHKSFGGTNFEKDYGIIQYWWSSFLNVLQAGEEVVMTLHLPLHEMVRFAWDNKIVISHVPYLVKSFIEPLPYTGTIQATMKRLRKEPIPVLVTSSGGVVTGVYAKLVRYPLRLDNGLEYSDVVVLLYSDEAGTIPYNPPTTLYVYVALHYVELVNSSYTPLPPEFKYYPVNSAVEKIIPNTITNSYQIIDFQYSLDPSGAYGYTVI